MFRTTHGSTAIEPTWDEIVVRLSVSKNILLKLPSISRNSPSTRFTVDSASEEVPPLLAPDDFPLLPLSPPLKLALLILLLLLPLLLLTPKLTILDFDLARELSREPLSATSGLVREESIFSLALIGLAPAWTLLPLPTGSGIGSGSSCAGNRNPPSSSKGSVTAGSTVSAAVPSSWPLAADWTKAANLGAWSACCCKLGPSVDVLLLLLMLIGGCSEEKGFVLYVDGGLVLLVPLNAVLEFIDVFGVTNPLPTLVDSKMINSVVHHFVRWTSPAAAVQGGSSLRLRRSLLQSIGLCGDLRDGR